MAEKKGFYKKHGIDLTLLRGGSSSPSSAFLLEGKADFATMWLSKAIQMRSGGHGIINVGQMMQRSALMLVAKKSTGIHRPEDINGKKVGLGVKIFKFNPGPFSRSSNLHVKVIPQFISVNLFLRDGVDVASAMWYNEYRYPS